MKLPITVISPSLKCLATGLWATILKKSNFHGSGNFLSKTWDLILIGFMFRCLKEVVGCRRILSLLRRGKRLAYPMREYSFMEKRKTGGQIRGLQIRCCRVISADQILKFFMNLIPPMIQNSESFVIRIATAENS